MTNQQAALLAAVRQDLPSFIAKCFATLEPGGCYRQNWHICTSPTVDPGLGRRGQRLIVNVPPRHLKSICVSVAYTAWVMGHDPGRKVIALSYGSELAEELARPSAPWSRATGTVRRSRRFRSSGPAGRDRHHPHGSRYACGLSGSILGRGADLIVIDDLQKVQAAFSESERRKAKDGYDNTISTRLNNKRAGAIVLVMQRLHEDDLVGHVLAREEWEVSTIPASAKEDQVYRVGPGRMTFPSPSRRAHPARTPGRDHAEAQRRMLGSMGFEAQYQQNPVPADGNAIRREWLRYYEAVPALDLTMVSWDTASTLHPTATGRSARYGG